jgi:hypothetical protein
MERLLNSFVSKSGLQQSFAFRMNDEYKNETKAKTYEQ